MEGKAVYAGQKLPLFLKKNVRIQRSKVKHSYFSYRLGILQVRFCFILKPIPECESAAEGICLLSGFVNTIQGIVSFCHLPHCQRRLFNVSVTLALLLPWGRWMEGATKAQAGGRSQHSDEMSRYCLGYLSVPIMIISSRL